MGIPIPPRKITTPLPRYVDDIATSNPDRVQCSIPIDDDDLSKGWRDINFAQTARAIDRLCEFAVRKIGRNTSDVDSHVAYIGVPDPRCHWLTIALQKVGHCVLMSAPRNSLVMHQNLFEKKDCVKLFYAEGVDTSQVIGDRRMDVVEQIPSLAELLADGNEPEHFTFDKTMEEMEAKTLVVLHTSGSSGLPKPINITYGYLNLHAELTSIKEFRGRKTTAYNSVEVPGRRVYMSFPPFHLGGLVSSGFGCSYLCDMVYVMGPIKSSAQSDKICKDVMKYGNVQVLLTSPAFLPALARDDEAIRLVDEKICFINFAGGSLDQQTGDILAKHTHLQTSLGSTECSAEGFQLRNNESERHLWNWFNFAPDQGGIEWEPQGDGSYEMVLVREKGTEHAQCIWKTFPDIDRYHTKDLFERHPDPKYPNHMRYVCRTDDLIAFANAGKYSPLAYENSLCIDILVRSALMFGIGKTYPGLLIELNDTSMKPSDKDSDKDGDALRRELAEKLWPAVEKINADAPKHAQVRKGMIIFASRERPFERAAKGTVVRQRTLKKYEREIEAAYADDNSHKEASKDAMETAREDDISSDSTKRNDSVISDASSSVEATATELLAKTNEALDKATETMNRMQTMFKQMNGALPATSMPYDSVGTGRGFKDWRAAREGVALSPA